MINKNQLYDEWDHKRNSSVYNEDKVVDFLEDQMTKGGNILDFHSCDFFPERWIDIVVLLRANNQFLYDRLKARNYTAEKITENIECEILEVTHDEVFDSYHEPRHKILELDNSTEPQMEQNLKLTIDVIGEWLKKTK